MLGGPSGTRTLDPLIKSSAKDLSQSIGFDRFELNSVRRVSSQIAQFQPGGYTLDTLPLAEDRVGIASRAK